MSEIEPEREPWDVLASVTVRILGDPDANRPEGVSALDYKAFDSRDILPGTEVVEVSGVPIVEIRGVLEKLGASRMEVGGSVRVEQLGKRDCAVSALIEASASAQDWAVIEPAPRTDNDRDEATEVVLMKLAPGESRHTRMLQTLAAINRRRRAALDTAVRLSNEMDALQLAHQRSIREQQVMHDQHAEKIAERIAAVEATNARLEEELRRAKEDVAALERELRRIRTWLDQVLASYSWRFGHAVVRAVSLLVRPLRRIVNR